MFSLACVGIDDLDELGHEVERLKSLHRLQGTELKSTQTKAKPKFVSDLARFLHSREWPVFIELVDKHYLVVANIVERLITLHLSGAEPSRGALFVKNTMADYCRFAFNQGLPHFVWSSANLIGIIRDLRSSGPALPYIARLIVFKRLIWPSA